MSIRENKGPVLGEGLTRPAHEEGYRTASDRRAEGKALRDTVPREEHGGWKPLKDRRDPVELVLESNKGRMSDLVPVRHGRMLQSPFAFYRGTAALMGAMGAALLAVASATYAMAIGHDGYSWTGYGIAGAITLVMPLIPWRHVRQLRGMLAA